MAKQAYRLSDAEWLRIKSLKAAIEFKYCVDESELKTAIEDIYADMRVYSGSLDWSRFYAVFFTTEAFAREKDILAKFKIVKADHNWTPFIVHGEGTRAMKMGKKKFLPTE